jgi:TonB-dependent starch-binding outer membrane protein SusC
MDAKSTKKLLTCLFLAMANFAFAQKLTVTGTVQSDGNNQPMIGVVVLEKGTTNGVQTDENGHYAIQVLPTDTLVFSYLGYVSIVNPVGNRSTINQIMSENIGLLGQVIVIGYGTAKKGDITGSVSQVGVERLEKRNPRSIEEAFQGEVSGVQISTAGRPGDQAVVRIRGYGTINNNSPLILVDNVEIGRFFTVDPNDIESVTVLKDAASAAIYGNRAANGVILITTKKGKGGKQTLSYNTWIGKQESTSKIKMLNASQYVNLLNEAVDNANADRAANGQPLLAPVYSSEEVAEFQGKEGTYWQDELLREGMMSNHYLNLSSSTDKSNFGLSVGLTQQEGIYVGTDFTRYYGKFSGEHKFRKRLKLGHNINLSYTAQNTGGDYYVSRVFTVAPTVPVTFEDGTYGFDSKDPGNADKKNPLAMVDLIDWTNTNNQAYGNVYAIYELFPGLTFTSRFNFDRRIEEKNYFEREYRIGNVYQTGFTDVADFKDRTWNTDNFLSFNRTFQAKHNVSAVLGTYAFHHYNNFLLAKGFYPVNVTDYVSTLDAVGTNSRVVEGRYSEYKILSVFGRVEYNYDNRYYLSATLRRDGTSRFSPENRWGNFPSIGGAWRVQGEKFLRDWKHLSDLKLRASWGQLGNSAIGDYDWQSRVSFNQNYVFGNGTSNGAAPTVLANNKITWETTTQTNFGADLGLFNNRLSFVFDWYRKYTTDMLLSVPQPGTIGGGGSQRQNIGEILNRGTEFELRYNPSIGKLNLSMGGNISFVHNEIISLGGASFTTGRDGYSHIYKEGYGLRSLWGYQTDGVYQNQAQIDATPHWEGAGPGDLIFKDINEDGVINADDRTYLGSSIPDYTYGFNLSAEWKGLDFSALVQGIHGNKIMYADANFGGPGLGNFLYHENLQAAALDRWHGEGTSFTQPRVYWRADPGNNNENSDFFVKDGSYIRLKNLQVGYTLPAKWLEKVQISRLRVYVGGTNLFTITKYPGFDPEIAAETSDSYGWDYPMSKTMIIGLNLDL